MLPWLICGGLAALALVLRIQLLLLQKSLDDITDQLGDRLSSDTNNPIFLPTRDPCARRLAARLNVQLKELRRQRQRYESGDRELKEAVTNVSHDLRTPLTAICGYLELLEKGDNTPRQARYLSLIAGRAQAMRRLIEELLRCTVAASLEDGLSPEYGIPPCTSYGCVTSNTPETLQPRAFSSVLPVKECLPVQRPSC